MKHDLSCFDQNSSVDDCCLNCSSSTLLAGCINLFINFMLNVSSIIQSRVPCVLSRMWSHMRYGKLLNYKDAHEQEDVFLSVPAESNSGKSWHFKLPLMFSITVWGKRWNFAHLFHCCTTYSMSLSLRCWSFDLIFTGSWRLSTYMVTNFLQILQLFFASFLFQSAQIRQIICDCFSGWINTWLTRNSRSLKKASFRFPCTCKQSPPLERILYWFTALLINIVGKSNAH